MTLSFLYARSGQIRNRLFHLKKQLFLKKFVNVIKRIHTSNKILILLIIYIYIAQTSI